MTIMMSMGHGIDDLLLACHPTGAKGVKIFIHSVRSDYGVKDVESGCAIGLNVVGTSCLD